MDDDEQSQSIAYVESIRIEVASGSGRRPQVETTIDVVCSRGHRRLPVLQFALHVYEDASRAPAWGVRSVSARDGLDRTRSQTRRDSWVAVESSSGVNGPFRAKCPRCRLDLQRNRWVTSDVLDTLVASGVTSLELQALERILRN